MIFLHNSGLATYRFFKFLFFQNVYFRELYKNVVKKARTNFVLKLYWYKTSITTFFILLIFFFNVWLLTLITKFFEFFCGNYYFGSLSHPKFGILRLYALYFNALRRNSCLVIFRFFLSDRSALSEWQR